MRLLRLDLLRYGHLSDVTLEFDPAIALHVVLGANEAGKSTALAAIGDALFGFPHSTPFDFLHRTAQLRIGFAVATEGAGAASFIRRKGTKDTLLDATGAPVADGALLRLLGGATRKLFEEAYGLNGKALRDGGKALLDAGGDAGNAVLTGMGLPQLHKARARLDVAAGRLHGDGRGTRALAEAIKAWKDRHRAAEDAAIRPRDWQDAVAERDRIEAAIAAAATEAARLSADAARLQRIRRVLPTLSLLNVRRPALDEVADAPALPATARADFDRLADEGRNAGLDAAREAEEAARLAAELAALPRDDAALAEQDAIDAIARDRPVVLQALRDLPEVERAVQKHADAVAAAAAVLGSAAAPEMLRDAVPTQAARDTAQRLLRRRTELTTGLATAEKALRDAGIELDLARRRLDDATAPPPAAPLRRAIEAVREEGRLDLDIAGAARALAAAMRRRDESLAGLPLWSGDVAALAACALPLPAAEAMAAARLTAARDAFEMAAAEAQAREAEIAELSVALDLLAAGGEVPTPSAIAAARRRRDDAWRALRDGWEAGAAADRTQADAFEGLRDAADRLADARADDAQRVNDYAAKTMQRDALRRLQQDADLVRAEAEATAAEGAWQALWAPAGIAAQPPAAMAEWRRARAEVLRIEDTVAEAREKHAMLLARREAAVAALRQAVPLVGAGAELAPLLAEAAAIGDAAAAAEEAHRKLLVGAEEAAGRAERARSQRDEAERQLTAFAPEWLNATRPLGLPDEAAAEAVEAALSAWNRIAEAAPAWRGDARRIADMRRTIAGFEAATSAALSRLDEAATEEAAAVAAARLERRLAASRRTEDAAAALRKQAEQRRKAAADAARRRMEAEAGLEALRLAAGAADLAALDAAIARSVVRDKLREAIAGLADDLLRAGDGHDEAALRAEAADIDPDTIPARLEEIDTRQAALREQGIGLGERRKDVTQRLATMEAGRDAAALAQEARHHLAEARVAAERFARLHVARSLLAAGIERMRQDHQGPLLRAAGDHLALLTDGRYGRLAADEDEAGKRLLHAIRDDGTECPVEALSEGTRDQLYLALRVAALEAHAAGAEPLPFIADDLLVTFDDARAAAALRLLAELGQRVQVILFTHHAHVAALATGLPGTAVLRLPAAGAALPAA